MPFPGHARPARPHPVLASLRKQKVSTSITKSIPIGVSGGERNSIIAIKVRPAAHVLACVGDPIHRGAITHD